MHFRYLLAMVCVCFVFSCGSKPDTTDSQPKAQKETPGKTVFKEITQETGLDFTHFNGAEGEFYFPEIMGAGGALFDYDNDGDLDLYLIQGNKLAPGGEQPYSGEAYSDRLYRNDLGQDGSVSFTDVTEQSGIRAFGYGMGAAIADIDNDGFQDLYLLNFGSNLLWRNKGDGTFEDITQKAQADDDRWSVSGSFFDMDQDGYQDLIIVNYVDFTLANNKQCIRQYRDYCNPQSFKPVPDRLLRNKGDGTFEDVTGVSGLASAYGNGLGVVTSDLNGDGRIDIYVANDGTANQLWNNDGGGLFTDTAMVAGSALNVMGSPEASMGVDAGDFDGDGDMDLFMTHLKSETNTLYVNDGKGFFEDRTIAARLEAESKAYTGFGMAWVDYDNDGLLDILSVNGDVAIIEAQRQAGSQFPYAQNNQLFHNRGGVFSEVTSRSGLTGEEVSRGAIFGDINNDGAIDVVITNNNGPARVYRNQTKDTHWVGLDLHDKNGPQSGVKAAIITPQGVVWRESRSAASYGCANDSRIIAGLGEYSEPVTVRIFWPDGNHEQFEGLSPGSYHRLIKGQGQPAEGAIEINQIAKTQTQTQTTSEVSDPSDPIAIPSPDLSALDASLRTDLQNRRASLDQLMSQQKRGDQLAATLGEMGRYYYAANFYEAAEACFQNARHHQSQNFDWHYLLARARLNLGKNDHARAAMLKAHAINPSYQAAILALADDALARQNLTEAGDYYRKVFDIASNSAAAYFGLGRVAFAKKDYRATVNYLNRALKVQPRASAAHYMLANAYRALGDDANAQSHLNLRGDITPGAPDPILDRINALKNDAGALRKKGEAAAQAGNLPQARNYFKQAVDRAPNDASLWLNLGEIDRLMGKPEAAIQAFQKILAMDNPAGQEATATRYLGEIYGELGRDNEAINHLRATLQLNPGDMAASFHLADALRRSGNFDEAFPLYDSVVKRVANNPPSRLGRVFSLIGAAKFDEAKAIAEEDLQVFRGNPVFTHILARLHAAGPNPNGPKAQQLLDQIGLGFVDSALAASHAMTAAARNDFAKALEWQQKAIDLAKQANEPQEVHTELARNLTRYQNNQTCDRPWPNNDPLVRRKTFRN